MSEQSKQAMADAFVRAAKSGLLQRPEDALEIRPLASQSMPCASGDKVLVITMSSFVFRLLAMFHVAETPESRVYYRCAPNASIETAFAEVVNLCCGALNRELSGDFPHIGMSIPYVLGVDCLRCLDELNPEHVSRFGITVAGVVQLEATLCICCSGPVEIAARQQAVAETTGELELF